jgi:hypothetical protein
MRPIKSSVGDFITSFSMIMLAGVVLTASVHPAAAQSDPKDQTFAQLRETQKKLGPNAILSGGARSLFDFARNWDTTKAAFARLATDQIQAQALSALTNGVVSGQLDLSLSKLAFFSQNESSTAWCDKNVVIGFNDTGSLAESFFSTNAQFTGLGYSVSADKGTHFTDMGFPTLSSDPTSDLGFDQVFTCASASNFYFSSLYNTATRTAVTVSASSDGGQTFGAPVIAASASNGGIMGGGAGHFFDGDWMAVNPANPQQLFVTYTDDDFSGAVCTTGFVGTSIKLVSSNDGGLTWGSPVSVVGEFCNDPTSPVEGAVEFSGVAVDPARTTVYVSWEFIDVANFLTTFAREVDIAKASIPTSPSPLSFGSPVKVSGVNFAGAFDTLSFGSGGGFTFFQGLQGRIETFEHPILAVGKGPKNTGVLYLTWNDGDNAVPDVLANFFSTPAPTYHFTDILLSSSADGAATWSKPVRINDNREDGSAAHPFSDQFHPTVATDKRGKIGVCFYDRRNDPNNFLIGRTCAFSSDGSKWKNISAKSRRGPSVANQDDFGLHDWLGDYETLATDSLNQNAGFIGGYTDTSAGYQNIRSTKFSRDDD